MSQFRLKFLHLLRAERSPRLPRAELINPKRANSDVQLHEQGAGGGRVTETAERRTTLRAAMPPASREEGASD